MTSASAFSRQLVRLCMAWLVARLTGVPPARALRSVSIRANVWLPYFHPARLRRLNRAFAVLYSAGHCPLETESGWVRHLAAQSLLVDGLDPITGSMTASLVTGSGNDFREEVHRFAPTGYVMRLCVQACSVAGTVFEPGDLCLTSLLPCASASETPGNGSLPRAPGGLAFGVGLHSCVGKSISLVILGIGERIFRAHFAEGFARTSVPAPDGAFLLYREGP